MLAEASSMLPLLRLNLGENYTGKAFNVDLSKYLGDLEVELEGMVTSHSLRS